MASTAIKDPAAVLSEAIQLCRRPFTAAAVKWKIQANPKDGDESKPATVVAFIDARLAGERLNAAGLLWSTRYSALAGGGVECEISVLDPKTGQHLVTRSDVGYAENRDKGMEVKSLRSDAFKRAAVHFGVGVSIYALPLKRLYCKDGTIKKLGKSFVITAAGQKALDAHYVEWLEKVGTPQFGEPVDHGDVMDAQGDVESVDRQSDEAVATEPAAPAPASLPDPKPESEPNVGPAPNEPVEPTGEKGAIMILEKHAQSTKSLEDLKAWLVAHKVEDTDSITETMTLDDLSEFLAALPKPTGLGMYKWLKNSVAKAEREAKEKAGAAAPEGGGE